MHVSGWMTSGAPGLEPALSQMVDESFGHDGTARVPRAEDENFCGVRRHQMQQELDFCAGVLESGPAMRAGSQQAVSICDEWVEKISASSMVR